MSPVACLVAVEVYTLIRTAETVNGEGGTVIGVDALRESAQRSLMQVLAADGDYAAAVQVYWDLRLHLHRELNTDPDPQTTALFQQLRAQAKRQAQAAHAPLLSIPTAPPLHRLPQPLSSLIGREQEIAEVAACLSSVRLQTLTGAGGVGKTRLAIAVAEAVADDYPDGVHFVDLAPLSDPALIHQTVAAALEIREEPGKSLLEMLRYFLQSKALLLVLDNCEHLLEGCVSVAASLLQSSKRLKILATSRQSLGITGELVWRGPSLPVPPVQSLSPAEKEEVGLWLEYASVQMFVDRAQLVSPDFRLSQANARWVVAICQHLDGIPLALELAAARTRAMPVEQILTHLDQRFRLLTGGSRIAPPRQQTLRATLDWSYQLLSAPEQHLLRCVSIFADGWSLEAAQRVCASETMPSWEILEGLTSLVDQSLVGYEEWSGQGRYRLLETIRQYGQEQMEETGEGAEARDRHLHYFLALVEAAEPHLQGSEPGLWLDRLEAEQDNLRAALEWSLSEGKREEGRGKRWRGIGGDGLTSSCLKSQISSLSLAGALSPFWQKRGYWSEGLGYLMQALGQAGMAQRTPEWAKALDAAASLAWDLRDYETVKPLLEQQQRLMQQRLALSRQLGDQKGTAQSLNKLGDIAQCQGDAQEARAYFQASLALWRELADQRQIAQTLQRLGEIVRKQGDAEAARAMYEECLALWRELGDRGGLADALNGLGLVASAQSDYETARLRLEQSLAIRQELGDRHNLAFLLETLGHVSLAQGDEEAAQAWWEQSLAVFRQLGALRYTAYLLTNLGKLAAYRKEYPTARALCEQSLSISREWQDPAGISYALFQLGYGARLQGRYAEARVWLAESLPLYQQLGDPYDIGMTLNDLGYVAVRQADYDAARSLLAQSLESFLTVADRWGVILALERYGGLAAAEGQRERAGRLYGATESLRERLGLRPVRPSDREERESDLAAVREALGEAAFAAAWKAGQAMTLEQAIEYALSEE